MVGLGGGWVCKKGYPFGIVGLVASLIQITLILVGMGTAVLAIVGLQRP